jgi:phosphoribosylaminoimidazole-succinocarboxamide synthase
MKQALMETNIHGYPKRAGKVRDIYDLDDKLLIVATDRISAFDVVMPTPIPHKGQILTAMSLFWFDRLSEKVETHLISSDPEDLPGDFGPFRDQLVGRMMLVRKAEVFPIECVVRGYLAGSGWKEYKKTGTVCGHELPQGMTIGQKLPKPIFTPATKAVEGHDENITFERAAEIIGQDQAKMLRDRSLDVYFTAAEYARLQGVIIADTKFEWGKVDGKTILIDEVLTPDSSRFWSLADYREGVEPEPMDKQYLRNWLETLDWDKKPPGPELPEEVVRKTLEKYEEAYLKLTGKTFAPIT